MEQTESPGVLAICRPSLQPRCIRPSITIAKTIPPTVPGPRASNDRPTIPRGRGLRSRDTCRSANMRHQSSPRKLTTESREGTSGLKVGTQHRDPTSGPNLRTQGRHPWSAHPSSPTEDIRHDARHLIAITETGFVPEMAFRPTRDGYVVRLSVQQGPVSCETDIP